MPYIISMESSNAGRAYYCGRDEPPTTEAADARLFQTFEGAARICGRLVREAPESSPACCEVAWDDCVWTNYPPKLKPSVEAGRHVDPDEKWLYVHGGRWSRPKFNDIKARLTRQTAPPDLKFPGPRGGIIKLGVVPVGNILVHPNGNVTVRLEGFYWRLPSGAHCRDHSFGGREIARKALRAQLGDVINQSGAFSGV